jgi:hypothetical protein
MGLFTNPLSHAGYPPRVTGTPETQPSEVRAATVAEANAGTLDYVYISPLTLAGFSSVASFASPPVLGFGSTTPRPVHATTLSSTGATTIGSGAGVATAVGNATGTLGFFGSAGATKVTQGAITNSVTAGGTTGTIANYTDLSVYANDSSAIRNDIYQLSLALANVVGALRSYGMLV